MATPTPPPPGWYPHPEMPGTRRYWDGTAWTDHLAPEDAAPGASVSVWRGARIVALGILIAIGAIWLVWRISQPTDVDCALQQADVALGERAAVEDACVGR